MRLPGSFLVSVLCVLGLLPGCGGDNPLGRKALSGVVNLDGAPLEQGSIEFHPLESTGVQSGALIRAGRYSIPAPQGATVGKYRVQIIDTYDTPPLPPGHMPGDPLPPSPKPKIKADWNSNSKHEIEVKKEGPFKFDFDVTTKGK